MKTKLHSALLLGLLALLSTLNSQLSTFAQGTSFTYQGRLNDGTNPAGGHYDFQFQVFDAGTNGSSYGSPNPNTATNVLVNNGLFTVVLDFGTGVFTGPDRWLQISSRTNGITGFGTLSPRQKLTPSPYAIYAANAAQVGGQGAGAFVAKAGDTMTGTLNLPANGLAVAGGQLFVSGGNAYVGNALNVDYWGNNSGAVNPGLTFGFASGEGISSKRTSGGNQFGLDLYTASTPRISITGGGYVGIGTSVPDRPLSVKSASSAAGDLISLMDSGGVTRWHLTLGNGNGLNFVQTGVADNRLFLNNNGNVGIGTASPAASLDVNGTVRASGVISAVGGLVIETRTGSDPSPAVPGQIWLRTDLP